MLPANRFAPGGARSGTRRLRALRWRVFGLGQGLFDEHSATIRILTRRSSMPLFAGAPRRPSQGVTPTRRRACLEAGAARALPIALVGLGADRQRLARLGI